MAKSIKKQFGKYLVKFDGKSNKFSISYAWSARDVEVFKSNLTAYQTLEWLRDFGLRSACESSPSNAAYQEAKEFLLPLIALEF